MSLFLIGFIEMIILTVWTKVVTKTRIWASGIVTAIDVLLWYYVIQAIIDNINNWRLALLYALGCALGTMISIFYFQFMEKLERRLKRYKKKPNWKKLIISVLSW